MKDDKPFWVVVGIAIVINLALISFGVWVVIKVMQHFGII